MKQIQSAVGEAPKLEGYGNLKYRLWVNGEGNLYVQIEDNIAAGTFTELLFSVSKYASVRNNTASIGKPDGYDLVKNMERISENTNDGAFLKAVLRHLLPE